MKQTAQQTGPLPKTKKKKSQSSLAENLPSLQKRIKIQILLQQTFMARGEKDQGNVKHYTVLYVKELRVLV